MTAISHYCTTPILRSLLALSALTMPLAETSRGTSVALAASPTDGFADAAIAQRWKSDEAAARAAGASWMWGPGPFYTDYEPNPDLPQGNHLVQYFDKGRLEINDPGGDKSSPWYVTGGLLVREMVSGAAQTGETSTYRIGPARIPVAGDAASVSATYADFGALTGRVPDQTGKPIANELLNGGVTRLFPGGGHTYTRYEAATGHNWAAPFWQYATAENGPFGGNWLLVLGYPITEPYYVETLISGQKATVLVQLFERRVLTSVVSAGSSGVEMGNVGRHYYLWRYANLNTANLDAHYSAHITVGPQPLRVTHVSQTVEFTNGTKHPLTHAVFRAVWRNWDGVFTLDAAAVDGKNLDLAKSVRWNNGVNLDIVLPSPAAAGQNVAVALNFTLKPRPVGGRSGYDRSNDILCLGDMFPTLVPWQNGGWAAYPYSELGDHGYYLTSTYAVDISSSGGERLIVGGTGTLQSVDKGRTHWSFAAPGVRDAGYVISPRFVDPTSDTTMTRQVGNAHVNAYFLAAHRAAAQRQLDLVLPGMRWLTQNIGAYPFTDYTVAEMGVPLERTDNYAQEYPMCYFIPTGWLAYGTEPGTWTWYTPVHEAGHQWFYSTVGSNQLTAPWLDEAMTSYITTEYVRANYPELYGTVWQQSTQGATAAKPVSSGVFSGFVNENEYSRTVYDKGVAMLDKVRRAMGDTAFYAAVRDYYRTFGGKQAAPQDLIGTLQSHSAADLKAIFSNYLGY